MINIDDFIKNNPYLYGILNLLIGSLVGHWLSMIRDDRKGFNEVGSITRFLKINLRSLPGLVTLFSARRQEHGYRTHYTWQTYWACGTS
ncbi:MAG: hypothetical protein KKG99_08130 [Bacteroidetes bacterium]|nr:hypothetical protein [Bacteroidota bacterium]